MYNTDLFKEINEELREEKLYKIIKKIIPFFLILALLLIIITIIVTWRNKTELNDQHKMSEIFYKAIATEKINKLDIAMESYDYLIDNYVGSYASLAALKKAGLLNERKDYEKAFKIYEEFTKENLNHYILKYLAETKIAIMLINKNVDKKIDIESVLDKLQVKNNPWRGIAMELKIIWLLDSHRENEAKNLIDSIIKDQSLSEIYKQRAEAIKSIKFKSS